MGAGYLHKCDKCDFTVHTSGPWEFYRDHKGKRKAYGHPVPSSEEARARGISGLSGELYCPDCNKIFDLILVEFKKASKTALSVWSGECEPKDEYKQDDSIKCPECGNINLILGLKENRELVCPQCKAGKLVSKMEWIV